MTRRAGRLAKMLAAALRLRSRQNLATAVAVFGICVCALTRRVKRARPRALWWSVPAAAAARSGCGSLTNPLADPQLGVLRVAAGAQRGGGAGVAKWRWR